MNVFYQCLNIKSLRLQQINGANTTYLERGVLEQSIKEFGRIQMLPSKELNSK